MNPTGSVFAQKMSFRKQGSEMLHRGEGEASLVKLCNHKVLKKDAEDERREIRGNYAVARRDAAAGQVTRMSDGTDLFVI